MLGPLTPSHSHEVEEVTPAPGSALARSVGVARDKGWRLVVGKWLVTGHPTLVLFDTSSAAGNCQARSGSQVKIMIMTLAQLTVTVKLRVPGLDHM